MLPPKKNIIQNFKRNKLTVDKNITKQTKRNYFVIDHHDIYSLV